MNNSSEAAIKSRTRRASSNSRAALLEGSAPFHASGTNASTTVMDPTATIVTPTGNLIGNLLAQPDPPFTWTYEFTDPIPKGVPLALVVRGTNGLGQVEEVVVPFQVQ